MQMDESLFQVLVGIISGLLVILLGAIVKYLIIPWYQMAVYRGIYLAGNWVGEQTSPRGKFGFKFELKQIGHSIKGTFYSNDEYGGKKRSRVYDLDGEIYHNHLFLKYKNKQPNQLGLGGFLFTIRDGGDELLGSMMFLQTGTGKVWASNELLLIRRPA
jgi:hypothetical protein